MYIHDQKTGLQSDVRSCIMLGLPTHLVPELMSSLYLLVYITAHNLLTILIV